jgi:hypothetical protein
MAVRAILMVSVSRHDPPPHPRARAKRAELQKIKADLECRWVALTKELRLRLDEFRNARITGRPAFADVVDRAGDVAERRSRCDIELAILDTLQKTGPAPAPEEEHNKKYRLFRDECIKACGGDMTRAKGAFIRRTGRKPYCVSPKTAKNIWSMLGRAQREK